MSSQTDPAGGPAAPPEADEDDRPSMGAALSRIETLVSALEADGVRVSEVSPSLAPEDLRDGYVTVSLTVGLQIDREPTTVANSDHVPTVESAAGYPGTSAGDTAADGGATTANASPRSPTGGAEPAVRSVEDGSDKSEQAWYCSVCGLGPRTHHAIETHRWDEDRCEGADIVDEEPEDTIPALTDEAWFCQECGRGPSTRKSAAIHASRAHDGDVAVETSPPETGPRATDGGAVPAVWPAETTEDSDEAEGVDLPDGLDEAAVASAAEEYDHLGDVAQALDLDAGTARVALVHSNNYERVREGGPTGAVDNVGELR